jgi:hypothetical protein
MSAPVTEIDPLYWVLVFIRTALFFVSFWVSASNFYWWRFLVRKSEAPFIRIKLLWIAGLSLGIAADNAYWILTRAFDTAFTLSVVHLTTASWGYWGMVILETWLLAMSIGQLYPVWVVRGSVLFWRADEDHEGRPKWGGLVGFLVTVAGIAAVATAFHGLQLAHACAGNCLWF